MKEDRLKPASRFREIFAWKGLGSIEFRVFNWAGRGLLAAIFIVYLLNSLVLVPVWAQVKLAQMQDASYFEEILDDAAETGNYAHAESWLKYRPLSESAAIIEKLVPHSGSLSSLVFFDFSEYAAKTGKNDEADFWQVLGLFRMRFDFLRCGLPDGVESGAKLMKLMAHIDGKYDRYIPEEKSLALVPRVLEFDNKYPAANDPGQLCRLLANAASAPYNPLPRSEWEPFREGLHETTEMSLRWSKGEDVFRDPAQNSAAKKQPAKTETKKKKSDKKKDAPK